MKANLILGRGPETEFFANFGTGFHSNDARAVVADRHLETLPTARGYEFGIRSKVILRERRLSPTYWVLNLDSELVFVGDEGTTEAAGPSHRAGIEFAMRRSSCWTGCTFSGDFTYTHRPSSTTPATPSRWRRADGTRRPDGPPAVRDCRRASTMRTSATATPTSFGTRPPGATCSST